MRSGLLSDFALIGYEIFFENHFNSIGDWMEESEHS